MTENRHGLVIVVEIDGVNWPSERAAALRMVTLGAEDFPLSLGAQGIVPHIAPRGMRRSKDAAVPSKERTVALGIGFVLR